MPSVILALPRLLLAIVMAPAGIGPVRVRTAIHPAVIAPVVLATIPRSAVVAVVAMVAGGVAAPPAAVIVSSEGRRRGREQQADQAGRGRRPRSRVQGA